MLSAKLFGPERVKHSNEDNATEHTTMSLFSIQSQMVLLFLIKSEARMGYIGHN